MSTSPIRDFFRRWAHPLTLAGGIGWIWGCHSLKASPSLQLWGGLAYAYTVCLGTEHFLTRDRYHYEKGEALTELALTFVYYALSFVFGVLSPLAMAATEPYLGGVRVNVSQIFERVPFGLQILALVLVGGFGLYWIHRTFHKVPWLWRFHAVHHSVHRITVLNTIRNHPFNPFIESFAVSHLFTLLGVPIETIFAYITVRTVSGWLEHSNADYDNPVLGRFLCTNRVHRWHHARLPEAIDVNFSTTIVIWDRLFGTYHNPASREAPLEVGLMEEAGFPVNRFWAQISYPFKRDASKVRAEKPENLASFAA
jgi:sterol desaturase/sphingolipid hydroxylase (fatty acid hydroxylase superfamily)